MERKEEVPHAQSKGKMAAVAAVATIVTGSAVVLLSAMKRASSRRHADKKHRGEPLKIWSTCFDLENEQSQNQILFGRASVDAAISNLCLPTRGKTLNGSEVVVLHVGSGDGRIARYISEHATCKVIALESDEKLHQLAVQNQGEENENIDYICGDIFSVDLGQVSAIVMWYELSALNHIGREKLLNRCFDLLKPDGSMFGEELVSTSPSSNIESYDLRDEKSLECDIGASGFVESGIVTLGSSWRSCMLKYKSEPSMAAIANGIESGSILACRYICKKAGLASKPSKVYKAEQIRQRSESGVYLRSSCVCVRQASEENLASHGCPFEVLLVQRKVFAGTEGKWSVPGGGVDPGEDEATAAHREALEEGGVVGELGPFLGDFDVSSEKKQSVRRTSAYVLHVTYELTAGEWTESLLRHRAWFPLNAETAKRQVRKSHDKQMLLAAERKLGKLDELQVESEAI